MDRSSVIEQLFTASQLVDYGRNTIDKQKSVIDRLEQSGFPTTLAKEILVTFEAVQESRIARRGRLTCELDDLARFEFRWSDWATLPRTATTARLDRRETPTTSPKLQS